MRARNPRRNDATVQENRRAGGIWLRGLRLQAGLSQRQLAERVGAEYYTFISQLENGRGRIPPERYEEWARALGVDASDFVFNLMRHYDPLTFGLLFGSDRERARDADRFEIIA